MNRHKWSIAMVALLFLSLPISSRAVLSLDQLKQTISKARTGDPDALESLQSELLYYQMLQGSPGMMTDEDSKNLKLIKAALAPGASATAAQPAAAPPRTQEAPTAPPPAPARPNPDMPAAPNLAAPAFGPRAVASDSAAQAPDSLIDRGEELLRQKHYDEARRQFEEAFAVLDLEDPRLVMCLERLGRLAVTRHDIATARVLFNKAVGLADKLGHKKAPGVAEAYLGLGLCQMHDGDQRQAVKSLSKGLKCAPGDETRGKLQRALEQAQRRKD